MSIFFPYRDRASDSDSDVLQAAEDEADLAPITTKHVEAFDRIKRQRRYIDPKLLEGEFSSDDEDPIDVTEQDFISLFRSHVKRKRLRRKIRANPDLEEVRFATFNEGCWPASRAGASCGRRRH